MSSIQPVPKVYVYVDEKSKLTLRGGYITYILGESFENLLPTQIYGIKFSSPPAPPGARREKQYQYRDNIRPGTSEGEWIGTAT
jgi:hypothetical protein